MFFAIMVAAMLVLLTSPSGAKRAATLILKDYV
jgi:hypothetical protein